VHRDDHHGECAGPRDLAGSLDWPWWVSPACLALVGSAAVAAMLQPSHRLELAALLAVAVAPWVLEVVRGRILAPAGYIVPVLAALAAIHVVGPAADRGWGWAHQGSAGQLSMFIGVWLVGQTTAMISNRAGLVSLAGCGVVLAGRHLADPLFDAGLVWFAGCVVAFAAGTLMRLLLTTVAELREAQERLAAEAAREERQRIAREVHDVIAHSMTVTTLHVTAARLAVERGDATGATEALEEAERAGRSSLRDLRATMGLLSDGGRDADPTASPEPGIGDLDELVGSWRAGGASVDLVVDGDPATLSPATGLVVYRVIQESLANAARHRPGSAIVVALTATTDTIEVSIRSRGGRTSGDASPGQGRGLPGMRERVEAVGGSFDAGPMADGWQVRASLPRLTVAGADR
jgi:signal transduction histidine kinase